MGAGVVLVAKIVLFLVVIAVLVSACGSAEEGYTAALTEQGLLGEFASQAAAINAGHRVCEDLDAGGERQGPASAKVAVEYFCPDYLETFEVLTTDDRYLDALAEAGLLAEFAAERAALRRAEVVCENLDNGADPEGSEADRIAVEYYCDDYLATFRVLQVRAVDGMFDLIDHDSSPSISGELSCRGTGGYSDLHEGTPVVVTNNAGEVLARTELVDSDRMARVQCRFNFTFTITEGEDAYIIEVADRGQIDYTFEELVLGPHLTLGD